MNAQYTEQDINSYLDAFLCPQPTCNSITSSPEVSPFKEDTIVTLKKQPQNEVQTEIKLQQLPPTPVIKSKNKSSDSSHGKAKDYLKNMYNNSLKYIVKRYISVEFQKKVDRIHRKLDINDSQAAKQYYKNRQEQTIGLTNLCDLLNYNQGSEKQKKYKKAFHIFYRWFMRKWYPIHILTTGKLQHADVYWRAKNILVYLPQLKKSNIKTPTFQKEISSISLTEISLNATL